MPSTESPLHLPRIVADPLQHVIRSTLLGLARYHVIIEGDLPDTPSLLLTYPHGEHANSILLPPSKVSYVAARDFFFQSTLMRYAISLAVDMLPITRQAASRETLYEEILLQQRMLHSRKKHVLVYPQGSRLGPAESREQLTQQIKPGVLLMAQQLEVPVIPIGLVYPPDYQPSKQGPNAWNELKSALKKGELPPHREVIVRTGQPLHIPETSNRKNRAHFAEITAEALWELVHGTETEKESLRQKVRRKLRQYW